MQEICPQPRGRSDLTEIKLHNLSLEGCVGERERETVNTWKKKDKIEDTVPQGEHAVLTHFFHLNFSLHAKSANQ